MWFRKSNKYFALKEQIERKCYRNPILRLDIVDDGWSISKCLNSFHHNPNSKVHGASMGPTWVLSAPDGPHVDPMSLAIRESMQLDVDCQEEKYSHNILQQLMINTTYSNNGRLFNCATRTLMAFLFLTIQNKYTAKHGFTYLGRIMPIWRKSIATCQICLWLISIYICTPLFKSNGICFSNLIKLILTLYSSSWKNTSINTKCFAIHMPDLIMFCSRIAAQWLPKVGHVRKTHCKPEMQVSHKMKYQCRPHLIKKCIKIGS